MAEQDYHKLCCIYSNFMKITCLFILYLPNLLFEISNIYFLISNL